VTTIENEAFMSCSNLKTIIFNSGIKTLGKNAFSYCSNLHAVFYHGSKDNWSKVTKDYSLPTGGNYKIYYYSDIEPAETDKYWHYDSDGTTPVIW
jgi:hypothetical protein